VRKSKKPKLSEFRLRIKLDIGDDAIGPGKARLLRAIDERGSISAAARDMGINYRRAWFLLETLNSALGQPVVVTTKGGSDGGGAALTEAGRAILMAYEKCVENTLKSTQDILDTLQQSLSKK